MKPEGFALMYVVLTALLEDALDVEAPWLRRPVCRAFGHTRAGRVSRYYTEDYYLVCESPGDGA